MARNTGEHGPAQRKGLQIHTQRQLQGNFTEGSKMMGAKSEDTVLAQHRPQRKQRTQVAVANPMSRS